MDKEEPNHKAEFSLKRTRMKSMLGLNIPLQNLLSALHRRPGLKFQTPSFKFALFPEQEQRSNVNS
jgi:hypothetical protein